MNMAFGFAAGTAAHYLVRLIVRRCEDVTEI
jgi:hypothetical protein